MNWFVETLYGGIRRRPIADAETLVEAVRAGAAYLSQGASYAYVRARSGLMGPRLMQDDAFGAAMERCKWEGFAAAAGDLILIVEAELRPDHGVGAASLAAIYARVVTAEPPPAHRRADGWAPDIEAFRARAAEALAGPGRGIEAIAAHTAERLLAFAPVEDAIRAADATMVTNNVKFRFIDHVEGLRKRLDREALIRALAAAPADAG